MALTDHVVASPHKKSSRWCRGLSARQRTLAQDAPIPRQSVPHRRMGWALANSLSTPPDMDGYRFAPPILRSLPRLLPRYASTTSAGPAR